MNKRRNRMSRRAVAEFREKLFAMKAENGKRIGDLTGEDLDELIAANTTRAKLFRELKRRF